MKKFFNREMYDKIVNGSINTMPSLIDYLRNKGATNIDGDSYIMHPKNCNLIIWPNVSDEFITCLTEFLLQYNDICFYNDNMTSMIYLIDGKMLRLPIIKDGRIDYKTTHWFPVIITTEKKVKGGKK